MNEQTSTLFKEKSTAAELKKKNLETQTDKWLNMIK